MGEFNVAPIEPTIGTGVLDKVDIRVGTTATAHYVAKYLTMEKPRRRISSVESKHRWRRRTILAVEPLHARAQHDLRFIRETMEQAASFTAVPGWGGVLMGVVGLGGAILASLQTSLEAWIAIWLGAALVAVLIGGWAMDRKARAAGTGILRGKGRKFVLALSPPLVAGSVLTLVLYNDGLVDLIPGTWLLLYGTAAVTGGAFSIRAVPAMGICFMLVGIVALFTPLEWGNWLLALGFGGLQVVFGMIIVRNHGG